MKTKRHNSPSVQMFGDIKIGKFFISLDYPQELKLKVGTKEVFNCTLNRKEGSDLDVAIRLCKLICVDGNGTLVWDTID